MTKPEAALSAAAWRMGLPPGPYYEAIAKDFEVYFSPGGVIWHRAITDKGRAALENADVQ